MSGSENHLNHVLNSGIVAILRSADGRRLPEVAQALVAGGVTVLEVTFTVPGAHRVLEQLADGLGDRVLLGAGTVLDTETARTAILAGAEFIVSPTVHLDVIRMALRYGKLVMPGAFSPTEVLAAWEAGAQVVKVFPADIGGPAYLKSLHGPLPQVRLMPTGGVNLDTAADFLRAGACALGIGSALIEGSAVNSGDYQRIESLARQYVEIVRDTRREQSG